MIDPFRQGLGSTDPKYGTDAYSVKERISGFLAESEFVLAVFLGGKSAHQSVPQCFGRMSDRVWLSGGILGTRAIEKERGEAPDKLGTAVADQDPGLTVRAVGKILSHQPPSWYPAVISGSHWWHTVNSLHDLKAAFAAILPAIPKVGRGNRKFDIFSS